MSLVTITIVNGEATVSADGTKQSCAAAHDVEAALGKVRKTSPTGTKPMTPHVAQR